ncbi:MAG: tryptophan-rich sensory protein [Pseudomonadota bacterium]
MRPYLSLCFLLATIAVNALANALPINGLTTGDISNRFDVYFTPAGYVFSIWGLIYLWLLAFAVYQLLPAQRKQLIFARLAPAFCLSCCANMAWIVLWHYQQFALTLVAMTVLLGCLVWIWRQLQPGTVNVSYGFGIAPFSLYLAWISVAILANLAVVLDVYELRPAGMDAQTWAIVSICAGTLVALAVSRSRQDLIYLAVFIWAYVGIVIEQGATGWVAGIASISLILMLTYWLWIAARKLAIAKHLD